MAELLLIEAAGSHYDIGFTVGQEAKKQISRSIAGYRKALQAEGWVGPWVVPEGCLTSACEVYPRFVEELRGMADGSGASFSDLFFLNALEEVFDLKNVQACSAIGLAAPDGIWLGHNEDWYAGDTGSVIAISARPIGRPAFLSVTAAPFLAAVGMNEAGLAQGVNSVSSTDCRVGIPRMFSARAVLEAESIEEACLMAKPPERAGGYNHLLVHRGREIGCYETTATEADYLPGSNITYHTNHYLSTRLQKLEKTASEHSKARYQRLAELSGSLSANPDPYEALSSALSDHKNRPFSVCRHEYEQESADSTIFSVIFNVTNLKVWVAVGNPCDNIYREVKF
jgi:isopenicillin-N N-acyltransferase like protein